MCAVDISDNAWKRGVGRGGGVNIKDPVPLYIMECEWGEHDVWLSVQYMLWSSISHWIPFFQFTTTQSNCFVLKFPSVRLQCHVVLLLVFVFRVSLFPSQKRVWQGLKEKENMTLGRIWRETGNSTPRWGMGNRYSTCRCRTDDLRSTGVR